MKRLTLVRLDANDYATYGQLLDGENKRLAVTLELPWRGNQHGISCIPPGEYVAHRRMSPKRHYELFELADVPDRSNIEIHIGNLPSDTEGCILLGTSFGMFGTKHGIQASGEAFRVFMEAMRGVDAFTLAVHNPTPLAA